MLFSKLYLQSNLEGSANKEINKSKRNNYGHATIQMWTSLASHMKTYQNMTNLEYKHKGKVVLKYRAHKLFYKSTEKKKKLFSFFFLILNCYSANYASYF